MALHDHILKSPSVSLIDHSNSVIEPASTLEDLSKHFPFQKECLPVRTLPEMEQPVVKFAGLTQGNVVEEDGEHIV